MSIAINLLKEKGLKVTESRASVLQKLAQNSHPQLLNELQDSLGEGMNRITLYRVLNDLESKALVKIFFGADGQKYIELKQTHSSNHKLSHLHFQCSECMHLYCVENVEVFGLPDGFIIKSDKTVLAGMCNNCQ
jgi:Fur family ferric uptake transcriptional regulator